MAKRRRRPTRIRFRKWRPSRHRRGKQIQVNTRGLKRLLILGGVCWGLWSILAFVYGNMSRVVMDFASRQAVNIATQAINQGILSSGISDEDFTRFIYFTENGNNPLVNQPLVNNYRATISQEIVEIMLHVQEGNLSALGLEHWQNTDNVDDVLFDVPWAAAFNLTLFHNIGPRFPVRARMMGNVESDVEIKIENVGINNSTMQVNLVLNTDIQVALPFRSQIEPVKTTVPLVTTIIQGEVPDFFWSSTGSDAPSTPPIVLPQN